MKPNIRAILMNIIEHGVRYAITNSKYVNLTDNNAYHLGQEIENSIWLQMDDYFTFDTTIDL